MTIKAATSKDKEAMQVEQAKIVFEDFLHFQFDGADACCLTIPSLGRLNSLTPLQPVIDLLVGESIKT